VILIACCAGLLSLAAVSRAFAGDASQIAGGGFLVGHAYRCGVSATQLTPSTQLIGELIATLSFDGEERSATTPLRNNQHIARDASNKLSQCLAASFR
jgi:hypothetical protein